jgi:SAM-dependent methyltransferase
MAAYDTGLYTNEYFRGLQTDSYSSALIVLPIVFDLMSIESVVDFGCGTGAWCALLESLVPRGPLDLMVSGCEKRC